MPVQSNTYPDVLIAASLTPSCLVTTTAISKIPSAVVDFVGGGEALVVFSVGFGDFDAGHRFGAVSGFRDWVCSGLVW